MRFIIPVFSLGALILLLCTPAALRAEDQPSPTPSPPLLEQRGIITPQLDALQRIRFRPVIPVPRPIEAALLAPFHNANKNGDVEADYGIGFEYVEKNHTFVLRQWPRAGGSLSTYTALKGEPACKDAYLIDGALRDVRGIAWQTTKFVFVLQPDDDNLKGDRGKGLKAEWHRLALRGACR
jgi:hypothetical protein